MKIMKFQYKGKIYEMTEDQIDAAHYYKQHKEDLNMARMYLNYFVYGCMDVDILEPDLEQEEREDFEALYLIDYEKAASENMLEAYLCRYMMGFKDDMSDGEQWESSIKAVLIDRMENLNN